jgi:hypothetical protein
MKRESLPGKKKTSHCAWNTGNYQRFQIRLRFVLAQTALKRIVHECFRESVCFDDHVDALYCATHTQSFLTDSAICTPSHQHQYQQHIYRTI